MVRKFAKVMQLLDMLLRCPLEGVHALSLVTSNLCIDALGFFNT